MLVTTLLGCHSSTEIVKLNPSTRLQWAHLQTPQMWIFGPVSYAYLPTTGIWLNLKLYSYWSVKYPRCGCKCGNWERQGVGGKVGIKDETRFVYLFCPQLFLRSSARPSHESFFKLDVIKLLAGILTSELNNKWSAAIREWRRNISRESVSIICRIVLKNRLKEVKTPFRIRESFLKCFQLLFNVLLFLPPLFSNKKRSGKFFSWETNCIETA